jgi:parallel beta-helix repeat protein
VTGGIEQLKQIDHYWPQSQLTSYRSTLEAYFREHPPATVVEAGAKITELTGIARQPTQVRQFLKALGMKPRKVVARDNEVHNNISNGIHYTNALDGVAESNTVYQNSQNGISYLGKGSVIHDNVVHTNTQFGIYIKDGIDPQVWDNSVSNNAKGELNIQGSLISPLGGQPWPGGCVGLRRGYNS